MAGQHRNIELAMTAFFFDLKRAFGALRKRPGFSAIVVVTMALGIGANVGLFAYLSYFLWPRIEAPQAERLAWLYSATEQDPLAAPSHLDFRDVQAKNDAFEALAAFGVFGSSVQTTERTLHAWGSAVSGEFFPLLGAEPTVGRLLQPRDDQPEAERVVVLNHYYWQRHFHGDPRVVGSTVKLDGGTTYTIVGVTRKGFQGTGFATGIYVPLATVNGLLSGLEERDGRGLLTFGRLAEGLAPTAAEAALQPLATGLDASYPKSKPRQLRVVSVDEVAWSEDDSPLMKGAQLLQVAVALLLLLACANVANLMLARAHHRRRELGMLCALGADRRHLAVQLLAESLMLATAGGALGLLFARQGLRLIEHYLLHSLPVGMGDWSAGSSITVNAWTVAPFFALVTLLSALLFGCLPILQMARQDLVTALGAHASDRKPGRKIGSREVLVVAQVALSLVLLTCAGLLVRSLWLARGQDPGFDPRALEVATFHNPTRDDDPVAREQYQQLLEEVRRLPAVRAASYVDVLPLSRYSRQASVGAVGGEASTHNVGIVADEYFATLGLPLLQGRGFVANDRHDSPLVTVVNRAMANRLWPDANPLGQQLRFYEGDPESNPGQSYQVIGVVADARLEDLTREAEPFAFFSFQQRFHRRLTLVARTVAPLEPSLRQLLRQSYPQVAIVDLVPFSEQLRRSLTEQRMYTDMAGSFALLGLLLAALGIFSVLSYSISQRRKEFSIRLAVGAERSSVVRLVLKETVRLLGWGLGLGLVATWGLARLLSNQLHGIGQHDPVTLAGVLGLLVLTALAAATLPAYRAARVDPMLALREE